MVRAQMPLIEELQTDEFWQDVTTPMLENVRRKLRPLIKLIEKNGPETDLHRFRRPDRRIREHRSSGI